MKKGKLIVLDGTDGSGKSTQVKLLLARLQEEKKDPVYIKFPQYGEYSATFVEKYLAGEFGLAHEIGPKKASLFYALDRFAAKRKMEQWLDEGKIIVADRYVSSNMIHQAGKIKNPVELTSFMKWLDELEFEILGIPRPDLVVFLNVPPKIHQNLIAHRARQMQLPIAKKADIHERSKQHLTDSYKRACSLVKKYKNWREIVCTEEDKMLSIDVIAEHIWQVVKKSLSR